MNDLFHKVRNGLRRARGGSDDETGLPRNTISGTRYSKHPAQGEPKTVDMFQHGQPVWNPYPKGNNSESYPNQQGHQQLQYTNFGNLEDNIPEKYIPEEYTFGYAQSPEITPTSAGYTPVPIGPARGYPLTDSFTDIQHKQYRGRNPGAFNFKDVPVGPTNYTRHSMESHMNPEDLAGNGSVRSFGSRRSSQTNPHSARNIRHSMERNMNLEDLAGNESIDSFVSRRSSRTNPHSARSSVLGTNSPLAKNHLSIYWDGCVELRSSDNGEISIVNKKLCHRYFFPQHQGGEIAIELIQALDHDHDNISKEYIKALVENHNILRELQPRQHLFQQVLAFDNPQNMLAVEESIPLAHSLFMTWAPMTLDGKTEADFDSSSFNLLAHNTLSGLQWLHSNGLVHRNITPDTILIHRSESGHIATITGFEMMRPKDKHDKCLENETTLDDLLWWRKRYYSDPDERRARSANNKRLTKYSEKADIWSLGLILAPLYSTKYKYRTTSKSRHQNLNTSIKSITEQFCRKISSAPTIHFASEGRQINVGNGNGQDWNDISKQVTADAVKKNLKEEEKMLTRMLSVERNMRLSAHDALDFIIRAETKRIEKHEPRRRQSNTFADLHDLTSKPIP